MNEAIAATEEVSRTGEIFAVLFGLAVIVALVLWRRSKSKSTGSNIGGSSKSSGPDKKLY